MWKIFLEGFFISKNLQVADTKKMQPLECLLYFLSNAAVCFAETYMKVLPYRQQGFIDFDLTFHPRLK